ncbi:hypothetical protein CO2235_MP80482 [Cupriavidus oxalaticus]|uniref:Uncharacterized protein n=1 Tax=Cupriavidus oxalaticus TaxID=96344 RepID=A0A976GE00_9BURK|nr:hypothetical protein CO2235_MP80482 [Cupriavidus oxalaticus]
MRAAKSGVARPWSEPESAWMCVVVLFCCICAKILIIISAVWQEKPSLVSDISVNMSNDIDV